MWSNAPLVKIDQGIQAGRKIRNGTIYAEDYGEALQNGSFEKRFEL
jgi:hypothetical protein